MKMEIGTHPQKDLILDATEEARLLSLDELQLAELAIHIEDCFEDFS